MEVDIKKYTSSIDVSPLLEGDFVEEKAYTKNVGVAPEAPKIEAAQKPITPNVENSIGENSMPPPPPPTPEENTSFENDYQSDGIDPMSFDEPVDEGDFGSPVNEAANSQMSDTSSDILIGMYSSIVPPILANMAKTNIVKVNAVLQENKELPKSEAQKIIRFLNTNNKVIEDALQLSPDQVNLLKSALSQVLTQYNLQPTNPIVNLIIVVAGIAIGQFMAVKAAIRDRDEFLIDMISRYNINVPEGYEGAFNEKITKKEPKKEEI
jgi:hypothetical protein